LNLAHLRCEPRKQPKTQNNALFWLKKGNSYAQTSEHIIRFIGFFDRIDCCWYGAK